VNLKFPLGTACYYANLVSEYHATSQIWTDIKVAGNSNFSCKQLLITYDGNLSALCHLNY